MSIEDSRQSFEKTLYPTLKQKCSTCHSTSSDNPLFASPSPIIAHDAILMAELVDPYNPGDSPIVLEIRGNHNGAPKSYADDIEQGIKAWVNSLTTPI